MTAELPQPSTPPPTPPIPPDAPLPTPPPNPNRWLPWVMGAAILVVLSATAGAVGYRVLEHQQPITTASPLPEVAVESAPPAAQVEPAPVQASKTALSPKETYIKMKTELENLETYTELKAHVLKYATEGDIAEFQELTNALSEVQTDRLIADLKKAYPSSKEITTIQEDIYGSAASLSVSTKSGQKGTITLVLENNQWKVSKEDWD